MDMEISEYIKDRLKKQQTWYEGKASSNKKRFMRFQTVIIILGALIPLTVVFGNKLPLVFNEWTGPFSAVISATIAILAGIDKLTQPPGKLV